MLKEEAEKLIEEEELNKYRRFSLTGEDLAENMTAVRKTDEGFQCIEVDERGGIEVVECFDNESDAFDDFIDRLRADKILRKL